MHSSNSVSLNAVRVFAATAEAESIKLAASRLGVTPGAVSRQVKHLEMSLGAPLFYRRNNSLQLTAVGDRFFRETQPGLGALDRAIAGVLGGDQTLAVSVPLTLATRWLIPKLQDFKERRPNIDVSVETVGDAGIPSHTRADVSIVYRPITEERDIGLVLLEDLCRPYVSPRLLSEIKDPSDLSSIPALQSTTGNWDWKEWLIRTGRCDVQLRYSGHFDLDEIALRASIAGAGMVLSSAVLVQDDVDAGLLCALPEAEDVLLGHYTLQIGQPESVAAEAFLRWVQLRC